MEKVTLSPRLGFFYPLPVLLVSCQGKETRPNIITIGASGVMCAHPPLIGIAVSPERYSHGLLESSGEWVINMPYAHQAELADYCGSVSGRAVDKFAERELTAQSSSVISVPRIGECPVNLECVCQDILRLGSHDWFVGEVKAVHVAKALYDEKMGLNVSRAAPLAWVAGAYWRLGEIQGRKGMSSR